MADDFKLEPPVITPLQPPGGARPGAGRPKGRRNKRSEINWRRAEREWPEIAAGIIMRAKRVADPLRTPTKEEYACAFWVGERLWPEPRGTPTVNVDLRKADGIIDAIEAGDLTPSDGAALLRVQSPAQLGTGVPVIENARAAFGEKLARMIEARQAQPAAADSVDIPEDVELTEEQVASFTARVEAAVKQKLNGGSL